MSSEKQINRNRLNAQKSRQKAIDKYNLHPTICQNCLEKIEVFDGCDFTSLRKQKFCSISCSASFTNRTHPKRKPEGKCKLCENKIPTQKRYCQICIKKFPKQERTIANVCRRIDAGRFNNIRHNARVVYKRLKLPRFCYNCKYDKHIEICHIKPIRDFDENTLISVVNSKENLIALCPNCHWEFDRGFIKF